MSSSSESFPVEEIAPCTRTFDFAIPLPPSIISGLDDPPIESVAPLHNNYKGIVGSVIEMQNSAMIWLGWGELSSAPGVSMEHQHPARGESKSLRMGSLMVAMPRTKYQGAFASVGEGASSKLIGSENEDVDNIGRHIASRLSQKLGIPVFVSCSFEGSPFPVSEGVEEHIVQQKAGALAEKEILRLLQKRKTLNPNNKNNVV